MWDASVRVGFFNWTEDSPQMPQFTLFSSDAVTPKPSVGLGC